MADEASGVQRSIGKIKQWIGWSWTYLWGFWFLLVIFLLYVLRTPLRLKENLNLGGSLIFISFSGKNQEIGAVLIFLKKWLPSPAIEGQITIILKCSIKTIFLLIFSPFWYLILVEDVDFLREKNSKWQLRPMKGWHCDVSCFHRLAFFVCSRHLSLIKRIFA